ncbi:tRNA 2-thiouridine(34) synthase MnmA [Synechococcus elongatus]|uniref:tRNA-specific 2-thiouridylase MnmA n=1 Tax=Synechococcus elongatus PCC 11801 TaxID=2219813 RepID=A0AAN1UUW8_SYNEL|nr:tRNA 2-thiouridine(34) synthase MnmA [Synechococcus elongatus]AZB73070.1 tRNA 2-thiouridine(34) synthase MnmA [Synechococcus elongatus PCC 11801]
MERVVVGLSGGVDSSVAAALLHRQGYAVEGLTLWLMKGKGQCCSEGMVDAAGICEQMGVPYHVVDSRDRFQEAIVDYVVQGYEAGITPLPCSQCNRAVKFGPMLDYAKTELKADAIATGHYARLRHNPETGRTELLRAVDRNKDQTYFLYDLPQSVLQSVKFPLGELTKPETRQIAAELGLRTAEKPESQDLCLAEVHGSMRAFLDRYIQAREGDIVDQSGRVLGKHTGIHHYTIGQRKGLGIAHSEPLYVIAIDPVNNRVVVGDRNSAAQAECTVSRVNWVSIAEPEIPIPAAVQVRYRSAPVPCSVIPLPGDRARICFEDPQFSITPGQAAVWYDGDRLLGGGIIDRAESLEHA